VAWLILFFAVVASLALVGLLARRTHPREWSAGEFGLVATLIFGILGIATPLVITSRSDNGKTITSRSDNGKDTETTAKVVRSGGVDWPTLRTIWDVLPVDTIEKGPYAVGDMVVIGTRRSRIQVINVKNGASAWPPYVADDLQSLAVLGERVIFEDDKGITALSATTGRRLWRQGRDKEGLFSDFDFIDAGDLLLANNGVALLALDPATGAIRWYHMLPKPVGLLGKILPTNSGIHILNNEGELYTINRDDGKRRFRFSLPEGDSVEKPIEAVGEVLVFPAGPRTIHAVTTNGLRELWNRPLENEVARIVPGNGSVYIVTEEEVLALDINSGAIRWTVTANNPAFSESHLYHIAPERGERTSVVAVNLDSGREAWRRKVLDYYLTLGPDIHAGSFVYVQSAYDVYVLATDTGEPRGFYKTGPLPHIDPTKVGEEIGDAIVFQNNDRLVAVRRPD